MDIFEFGMQAEKDGEAFYRDLAAKCTIPGMKKILTMMADDEAEHYEVFKSLKEKGGYKLAGSTVIKDAKNIFAEMKEKGTTLNLEGNEVELYKQAVEVEDKNEAFYREKAEETDDPAVKEILIRIADEERHHAVLMENMVIFLSRPESWLENAEFTHLDEY